MAEKKYQVHDQFASYSAAEKKLQQSENEVYYLKHFINTKSKDINYEDAKNECLAVGAQLNKLLNKWNLFNLFKTFWLSIDCILLHFNLRREKTSKRGTIQEVNEKL